MKVPHPNTCIHRGESELFGFWAFLIFLVAIAIPIYWGTGVFLFPAFAGTFHLALATLGIWYVLQKRVTFCARQEYLHVRHPFRFKQREMKIPYSEIRRVVYIEEKHRAGLYGSHHQLSIELTEQAIRLSVRKATLWRKEDPLQGLLQFFHRQGCKVTLA